MQTGIVGREVLQLIVEEGLDFESVFALASSSSLGKKVSFGMDRELDVLPIDDFDFYLVDLVIFATESSISSQYIPKLLDQYAHLIIIDESSAFRMRMMFL